MVKVDGMPHDVNDGEKEPEASNVLVHIHKGIERDEFMKKCFPEMRDCVPTHSEEESCITEHLG